MTAPFLEVTFFPYSIRLKIFDSEMVKAVLQVNRLLLMAGVHMSVSLGLHVPPFFIVLLNDVPY